MRVYGVIMAGGGGTRFWPLSRQKKPKQLLNLSGKALMINEAVERLSYTAKQEDIFIVTNSEQVSDMRKAVAEQIPSDHILSEPSSRNTSACIGYAAMEIIKKYGDGIMVITPSDAYIQDTASFTRTLATAVRAAEKEDKLITIGITPSFPATGYGYIKFDKEQNAEAKTVLKFKEKPDEETAKSYLSTGRYVWNSGMFIWKASTILKKFKEFIPDIYADIEKIGKAMNTDDEYRTIDKVYSEIRKISVDYAILEPSSIAGDVLVVPGNFGWNDVGSWDMMEVLHKPDSNGNIKIGDVLDIDTKNSVIYSNGRFVSVLGVENLIVVETSDSVMICDKGKAQDVKKIVDAIQEEGRTELL